MQTLSHRWTTVFTRLDDFNTDPTVGLGNGIVIFMYRNGRETMKYSISHELATYPSHTSHEIILVEIVASQNPLLCR